MGHAHFTFFAIFIHGPHSSCLNMIPAHLPVTGVAVYPALLKMHKIFLFSVADMLFYKSLSVGPSVGPSLGLSLVNP